MTERREAAGADDLRRLLGEIEDARVIEILALSPTVADVEIAAMWAEGQGDVPDRAGQPLEGTAARIYEIVTRDVDIPEL